ncbi:hypothetical protein D3C81_1092220 [compost metagenome]
MPQRQRPRHRVVEAVGPAGVGQVPERVFVAQVDGVAHIAGKRGHGLQRHQQRLGRAGGARGEHHQEGIVAAAHHRLEAGRLTRQLGPEAEIAGGCVAGRFAGAGHGDDRRRALHLVELGTVDGIRDHHFRARAAEPVLDGLGAERGEQRLVHRTGAPGAQDGHEQLGRARQQPRNAIARLHALRLQEAGKLRRPRLQLGKRPAARVAVAAFPVQRDAASLGMAVAAFHAGVDRIEAAVQLPGHRLVIGKAVVGLGVVAHGVSCRSGCLPRTPPGRWCLLLSVIVGAAWRGCRSSVRQCRAGGQ